MTVAAAVSAEPATTDTSSMALVTSPVASVTVCTRATMSRVARTVVHRGGDGGGDGIHLGDRYAGLADSSHGGGGGGADSHDLGADVLGGPSAPGVHCAAVGVTVGSSRMGRATGFEPVTSKTTTWRSTN